MNHSSNASSNSAQGKYGNGDKQANGRSNDARELFPIQQFTPRSFFHPAVNVNTTADFRPNVVPVDAPDQVDKHYDCKYKCSPACTASGVRTSSTSGSEGDPKALDSSATDSATPSGSEHSETGNSESHTTELTSQTAKTQNDQNASSERTENPASAERVEAMIPPSRLPSTLEALRGNLKEPAKDTGSGVKPTLPTGTSSSQVEEKQQTPLS